MLSLALLSTLAFAQDSVLLPETPEDWRFERIDFPLSFAPEIDYTGFEELRFAPGMFDAESDSFFSYVLAIRIEDELTVDEPLLQTFLLDYYVGLCRVVGESRNLDLDLDAISVHVELGGHGYEARIQMFDAFVTGKPLTLDLELSVHEGEKGIELLGLASPKQKTAAIWGDLWTIASRWRAERAPQTFLNHLYYIPDPDTYAAIVDSGFLNGDFGVFEERTTVRPDRTYTGRYFYGRNTYFEFLQPEPDKGFNPGNTGIAFGVEDKGASQVLAATLEDKGIRTFAGPMKRQYDGEQLPWFHIMGIERATTSSRLDLFSMEYDPNFLEHWHPKLAPVARGIERASVLQRYAAHLGMSHANALFQDVVEIHVRLPLKDRERLLDACRGFGYRVAEGQGEAVCEGPGYRIRVRTSETAGGISAFVVKLDRALETRRIELGKLVIDVKGNRAVFRLPVD